MKLLIEKNQFENMLSTLQPFVEKKDVSQITSHILIKAKENELTLKATDYEIGLKITTKNLIIEENGIATVNGKKLLEIIKRLKNENVILEASEDSIVIKQGKSKFKLPMFEANEYPEFPNIENKPKIEINSLKLLKSIKKAIPAIDSNNPKFELNGALIDIKTDKINIVSTDTKRLSIVTIENENNENQASSEFSLIVPKKALVEIQKIFFEDIEIYYDEVNLIIKSQNYEFYTKLINGNFPKYERIIPKEIKNILRLPKQSFSEEIKLITSISNEIKITLTNSKIIFESLSNESSEAKSELEFNTDIKSEITLGVNSKYLIDFLSLIDSDEFLMEINEGKLPFTVKSENFITVIMPIVI